MSRPAETILLAEKHTDDICRSNARIGAPNGIHGGSPGNFSALWASGVPDGAPVHFGDWGPDRIPNGLRNADEASSDGPSGTVSTRYRNSAAFVFVEGHAAWMNPSGATPTEAPNR